MAEPLKHLISADVVRQIAHHLQRVNPAFARQRFEPQALQGLDGLALKARVMQVARALVDHLPSDVDGACQQLEASLGPAGQGDQLGQLRTSEAGLAGWAVWPLTEAVTLLAAEHHPARGLAALQAMTQRLTAEYAIRPFLVHHPVLTQTTLAGWLAHPSAHVRRLVSEGSRPRLPWGLRLQALVADPSPSLPLLRALQDDPSAYVRRSVANHLNDIAKDHPDLIAHWLACHLPGATPERLALLRHACRGLIKQGDGAVLAAWGLGAAWQGRATLALSAPQVAVGQAQGLTVQLQSTAARPQKLVIDYAVHHAKANGRQTHKVFKGWALTLLPGAWCHLQRQHSFRIVSTRRYHAGPHAIDLRINGAVVAHAGFELLA